MKVGGRPYRTIWLAADGWTVEVIDQTQLPHAFVTERWETAEDAARGIKTMVVRGAPLIGAAAAYGLALALKRDSSDAALAKASAMLLATRPTAVNLRWALDDVSKMVHQLPPDRRAARAYARAAEICDEDVAICESIGNHGVKLIEAAWDRKGQIGRAHV